ncbi:hypothetical protein ACFQ22_11840 [Lentilactobacillus raoultii]|uniref:Transcriptional regulator n=1 Tax=Lentilactobacillus raoultii TaxID=1987503 RepID=A0ABW3PNC0_9LACO|nr:hypothetical protein [Lentilactobacillus raoultii]
MSTINCFFNTYQRRLEDLEKKLNRDQLLVADELTSAERELAMEMVHMGLLENIAQRVFVTKQFPINDFLLRQLVLGQGVYTGNTALYLWHLSDAFPYTIQLAVRMGYQVPKQRYLEWTENVQFKQVRQPRLEEDVKKIDVAKTTRKILVYSPERVLVELIKSTETDKELLKAGIQRYLRSPQRNLNQLLMVSKRLKAEKKVQFIMETLL